MGQNREPRGKKNTYAVPCLMTRRHCNSVGKRLTFQKIMLGQLKSYSKENDFNPYLTPYIN